MAQSSILEFQCKKMIISHWDQYFSPFRYQFKSILVSSKEELMAEANKISWLKTSPLVVKPDMMFGKRGKHGLVYLKDKQVGDVTLSKAAEWIEHISKAPVTLNSGQNGHITRFIVEPFFHHQESDEYYVSIETKDTDDIIHISLNGGVDIEENWDAVTSISIPVDTNNDDASDLIKETLKKAGKVPPHFLQFIQYLYLFFKDMHFSYIEFNPIIIQKYQVTFLDAVAKLDDTAKFINLGKWQNLEFQESFGMAQVSPEERNIKLLDEESGASLKLTLLNTSAPVWTLVAGGGASVVYADTIASIWGYDALANYGEYSGNPSTEETYIYTKTVLDLMTREKIEQDKVLLIGGAIANFTDVAKTFQGIIQALTEYKDALQSHKVRIYVRRGGPNYKEGLNNIKQTCEQLGLPIKVFGPENHMTEIVAMSKKETAQ